MLRLLGEASTLKNQLAQIDEYLLAIERDTARSKREEETASADMERLETIKVELSEKMAARQMELESVVDRRKAVEDELNSRKTKIADVRRLLDQTKTEASRLKARKDSLEEVMSHRTYTTETVKRLFTALEHGETPDFKPIGVLADFVEVDPAYEKAAEEFLHEELEYVVVHNWDHAERGIDFLRADMDGRATFLVHPEPSDTPCQRRRTPPARRHYRLPERSSAPDQRPDLRAGRSTPAPGPLLSGLGTIRCPAPGGSISRCVSAGARRRQLSRPCGERRQENQQRSVGLKRELRELTGEVRTKQHAVDQTTAELEAIEREIASLTDDLEHLRGIQQRHEKEALALDHEHRKLAEEFARAGSKLSVARLELRAPESGSGSRQSPARTKRPTVGRERSGAFRAGAGAGTVARRLRGIANRRSQTDRRTFRVARRLGRLRRTAAFRTGRA